MQPTIDWPAPDEITQHRLGWQSVIVDGGLKSWSSKPDVEDPNEFELLLLQRDELYPGPPLPDVDFGPDSNVLAIDTFTYSRCAVIAEGGVKCWGRNDFFLLGVPDEAQVIGDEPSERGENMPYIDLGSDRDVVGIAAKSGGHCVRFGDGRVKCWGYGDATMGLGDLEIRGDDPSEMGDALPYVDLGTDVRAAGIDGSGDHVCIWIEDGRVKCWGNNDRGQLGVESEGQPLGDEPGEMGDALPYVDLGDDVVVVQVSVAQHHSCALTDDGRIKCWGANSDIYEHDPPAPLIEPDKGGRLGLGDMEDRRPPLGDGLPFVDVGSDLRAVAVEACPARTCAVFDDGRLKCWGFNGGGLLGVEDEEDRGDEPGEMGDALPFVDLGTDRTVRALHCSCALLDDDTIKCWGVLHPGAEPGDMGDNLEPVITREDLFGID